MKRITTLVLGLGLMTSSALFAGSMSSDKKMMNDGMKSDMKMDAKMVKIDKKMMNHGMQMKDENMMKKDKMKSEMMDDKMMKKDKMKPKM